MYKNFHRHHALDPDPEEQHHQHTGVHPPHGGDLHIQALDSILHPTQEDEDEEDKDEDEDEEEEDEEDDDEDDKENDEEDNEEDDKDDNEEDDEEEDEEEDEEDDEEDDDEDDGENDEEDNKENDKDFITSLTLGLPNHYLQNQPNIDNFYPTEHHSPSRSTAT